MTSISAEFKLAEQLDRLESGIAKHEARLQADIERHPYLSDLTPDDMLDQNGRPILIDARVALVNGYAALIGRRG